jgi:hypothetical protein
MATLLLMVVKRREIDHYHINLWKYKMHTEITTFSVDKCTSNKYLKFNFRYLTFTIIAIYSMCIQFSPPIINVLVGALLSLIFYSKFKFEALVAAFIAFYASSEVTFGGIISFSGLLFALFWSFRLFKISKEAVISIALLLFYLTLTLVFSFSQNLDELYWIYLQKNIYKELIIPLVIVLVFSGMRIGGRDYLELMFSISLYITIGQILSLLIGNEVTLYIGYQFTISCLLLLFSSNFKLKILSFFNIFIYIFLLIKGYLYFSSQDVMLILLVSITYLFSSKRKLMFVLITCFLILYLVIGNIEEPYSFLKNTVGLSPAVSFKLTQIFLVVGSSDFSTIPWSARVRLIEFINTFDRGYFNIFFGSGYVSSINESIISFVHAPNEFLGPDDFSFLEISSGNFYGLHNFPRGVLHYGGIYFVIIFCIFYNNHRSLIKCKADKLASLMNVFLFVLACWNPSILYVFFMLSFKGGDCAKNKKDYKFFIRNQI